MFFCSLVPAALNLARDCCPLRQFLKSWGLVFDFVVAVHRVFYWDLLSGVVLLLSANVNCSFRAENKNDFFGFVLVNREFLTLLD